MYLEIQTHSPEAGATAGMHIWRLPIDYTTYFSGVFRHTSLVIHAVGLCPQNVGS